MQNPATFSPSDPIGLTNPTGLEQFQLDSAKATSTRVGEKGSSKGKAKELEPPIVIQLPFPGRQKREKVEEQFGKFLKVVKNLEVTLPFTELIERVPSYAKFMKDIITRKRKIATTETAAFTESSSTTLQGRSPPKLDDPGSFSITCIIGNLAIQGALCDLGASVSVMPSAIAAKLNIGPLKVTKTTLQLADRSVIYPLGVLEDVPVKIGKFFIPVDFIVLDIPEDSQVPIILGRPFLYTAGAVIDVRNGSLTFEVGDEKIRYNLDRTPKPPVKKGCLFAIGTVSEVDNPLPTPPEVTQLDQEIPSPPIVSAGDPPRANSKLKGATPKEAKPKDMKTKRAKTPVVRIVPEWKVREDRRALGLKALRVVKMCFGDDFGEANDHDPGEQVEATRPAPFP